MNIHENIRLYRNKLGWTLEELGKKIEVSKQTINRYETGEIKNIPYEKIEMLAKVFNITRGELMGWEQSEEETDFPRFSPDHIELISLYEKLSDDKKKLLMNFLKGMIE